MQLKFTTSDLQRFWSHVHQTDSCWLWTGAHNPDGCGRIRWGHYPNRHLAEAPRVSWEIHFRPIPPGQNVCHNCPDGDNPACVNPAHLWLGTQGDNVRDCWAKGRHVAQRGEASPISKLTAEQVRNIRADRAAGVPGKVVALRYGITDATVCDLVKRRSWRHLEEPQADYSA